jgi:hypothetical protein
MTHFSYITKLAPKQKRKEKTRPSSKQHDNMRTIQHFIFLTYQDANPLLSNEFSLVSFVSLVCVMHTCTYLLGWNSLVRSYKYWVVSRKAKELEVVQQQQSFHVWKEQVGACMVHKSFHMSNSHSLALYSTSAPQFILDTLFCKPTTILKFNLQTNVGRIY